MKSIYTVSLSLLLGAVLSSAVPRVVQEKKFMLASVGAAVEIPCQHDESSYSTFLWYRQHRSTGLTLIGVSVIHSTPDYEKGFESGYSMTHPDNLHSTLKILKPTAGDMAMYFCAASIEAKNTQYYFGNGTKLTILEDGLEITPPNVTLFDPSPEEIRAKKKATLVCLATGFYPDHVEVTWTMNDVARTEGVGTDENPTRDEYTRMYSISSRLRLSLTDWFRPQNTFQCNVQIFHPEEKMFTQKTRGREGCGLTAASYRQSGTAGRFLYLLLLCKSVLCWAVLTGLAYHKAHI